LRVIDIDPDLLLRSAEAATHAGSEGWRHMKAEFAGKIPELMDTLRAEGPYAYTIMPQIFPDGSVKSPILRTREEISEAYKMVRGYSDLLSSEPLLDLRGAWYQFTEAITRGQVKGEHKVSNNHVISLFPLSSGAGITGELVWVKVNRALMGLGPAPASADDEIELRRKLLALHERHCEAWRAGDAAALVETCAEGAQGAVRDYLNDTGTLIQLDGVAEHLSYYQTLFEKYEILSVDLLHRATQEWYVFAELRVQVRTRAPPHKKLAFHIADFAVPAKDGRFIIRVGHGTDMAWPASLSGA
jgi:hypothetical protein